MTTKKEWIIGNKRVIYERRSKDGLGRFGGGWQWAIGFEASEGFRSIVFNLLFFQVMVYPRGYYVIGTPGTGRSQFVSGRK